MGLLSRLGPAPVVSDEDIILAMFPKCMQETECLFLLGNYMQLVDKEVVAKQKELLVDTLRGVLEAKLETVKTRAVPKLVLSLE